MILLTGCNGKLGTELKKLIPDLDCPDFDFTKKIPDKEYDMIIHAGAYTNVAESNSYSKYCFEANVFGTFNLVRKYKNTPFVYISTEYARNPCSVYALTKYLGEEVVKTHPRHLIIRTLFKPKPWPFEYAFEDQYTNGDYVDVIAKIIAEKINEWSKHSECCYIGTGRKTMLELARQTRPNVLPNKVNSPTIPKDYED